MSERISRLREAPDPTLVKTLESLINAVVAGLDEGRDCDQQVAQINALCGRDYPPTYFFELYGWAEERDVAEIAAKGSPPLLSDFTREELAKTLQFIAEGTEPDNTFFLELLDRNFPAACAADLIFHSHPELSDEQIIDEITLRQNLFESGGNEAVNAHINGQVHSAVRGVDAASE